MFLHRYAAVHGFNENSMHTMACYLNHINAHLFIYSSSSELVLPKLNFTLGTEICVHQNQRLNSPWSECTVVSAAQGRFGLTVPNCGQFGFPQLLALIHSAWKEGLGSLLCSPLFPHCLLSSKFCSPVSPWKVLDCQCKPTTMNNTLRWSIRNGIGKYARSKIQFGSPKLYFGRIYK
jgi:hypothetical protein